jgi:hypothetical protein
VNTKSTSTKATSSTRSTTISRTSRRVSKLALFRVKVATVVLSMVAFVASLTSIAIYKPGVENKAAAPVQVQQITIVRPSGSDPLLLVPQSPAAVVRPFVRSRGS